MPAQDDGAARVPIIEERATIDKVETITGTVRVRTVTDVHDVSISDDLTRSEVEVVRVPVGRFVEQAPAIEERDGVTVVPVIEERLITEKRLYLLEEVHLRRIVTIEPVSQTISLRSMRAVIERD